jgi:hypothetical protein
MQECMKISSKSENLTITRLPISQIRTFADKNLQKMTFLPKKTKIPEKS